MDKTNTIAIYNQDQRIQVEYPDARRETLQDLVRHVDVSGTGEGVIIYSCLDEDTVDRAIRTQVDYFEALKQDFEWKAYDYDTPPDLKERLAAFGFEVHEPEAILVLPVDELPEDLLQPVACRVERATSPKDLREVQHIEEAVWDEDQTQVIGYLTNILEKTPNLMGIYIAFWADTPAACGWVYFPIGSQFASLWGGSTLEPYRGKGLYTALLAARAQEAKARGVKYLTVDASPMSQPILERHGFRKIASAYACKWKVGSA